MDKLFKEFDDNLRLTDNQEEDAKTKYKGVFETIHVAIYPDVEINNSNKYLFGSYKKKTNIRPLLPEQDVDLLVKIPKEMLEKYQGYESNGPSALLNDWKNILKDTYTTTETIKAWGKVILVEFTDNCHNVELLPAYEQEDGTFIIPNTENGGSWDIFDPRKNIDAFQESNQSTSGLTAQLSRMMKSWQRQNTTCTIKSYQIEDIVIAYLKSKTDYPENYLTLFLELFCYGEKQIEEEQKSFFNTATGRLNKALSFYFDGKEGDASDECKKIFGSLFPKGENQEKNDAENGNYFKNNYPFIKVSPLIPNFVTTFKVNTNQNIKPWQSV